MCNLGCTRKERKREREKENKQKKEGQRSASAIQQLSSKKKVFS